MTNKLLLYYDYTISLAPTDSAEIILLVIFHRDRAWLGPWTVTAWEKCLILTRHEAPPYCSGSPPNLM